MKKPNKKDYNFNDHFECLSFASQMIKYVDYLQCKDQRIKNDKLVEFANELKKVGYHDFDYIEKVVNTYNKKITQ